jgi:hypothetical protein
VGVGRRLPHRTLPARARMVRPKTWRAPEHGVTGLGTRGRAELLSGERSVRRWLLSPRELGGEAGQGQPT